MLPTQYPPSQPNLIEETRRLCFQLIKKHMNFENIYLEHVAKELSTQLFEDIFN